VSKLEQTMIAWEPIDMSYMTNSRQSHAILCTTNQAASIVVRQLHSKQASTTCEMSLQLKLQTVL